VNRALDEKAALGASAPRSAIGVSGKDRAAYLQGLLTNDIQALTPGTGCYAAWLTPQGRMLTDLHVFESGDMILLDVPAAELAATLQRLDQFLFSEDVQLANLADTLTSVWIHGSAAPALLEQALSGLQGLASWPEYHNARATFDGVSSRNDPRPNFPVVVGRVSQLGVPGFVVYVEPAGKGDLERALVDGGAVIAEPSDIEAARIEAGYPVFGVDMAHDTIPLEAGIEERAISFTKGCYVGQEVIIRVLHRGHGRVARKLVAIRLEGEGPISRGAKIHAGDRDVGAVTSAAISPALGSIALGYVHRDFTEAGTQLSVEAPAGRLTAVVSGRPLDFARGRLISSAAR
jgi:folate-binding protein YgfZ